MVYQENRKMSEKPQQQSRRETPLPEMHSAELAHALSRLDLTERLEEFGRLPKDQALSAFQYLDPVVQEELLDHLPPETFSPLLNAMDPDDRARLLERLPEEQRSRLLQMLDRREQEMTSLLLTFEEESAGRIMTPEFLHLTSTMTAEAGLAEVRRRGRFAETIYTLPVVDQARRPVGMLELKDLVLAETQQTIGDLMNPNFQTVKVDDDQETVARMIQSRDVLAAPVVDSAGRLVGLVTVDDAMDVLDLEEDEDLALFGATLPLGRSYFSASVFHVARSRVVWLLVLTVAATLTVTVLSAFQDTLESIIGLALFIPLLIGTGGNAGAQSATTVVRALAVSDIQFQDFLRVIFRETRTGIFLGGMLGLLSLLPVWFLMGRDLAVIVSLTLVAVCCLATLVGSAMPIIASRLSLDPAVVSAPFVTTIVDALGLLIYFLIAQRVLAL
jgi:magnesium transporter